MASCIPVLQHLPWSQVSPILSATKCPGWHFFSNAEASTRSHTSIGWYSPCLLDSSTVSLCVSDETHTHVCVAVLHLDLSGYSFMLVFRVPQGLGMMWKRGPNSSGRLLSMLSTWVSLPHLVPVFSR